MPARIAVAGAMFGSVACVRVVYTMMPRSFDGR